MMEASAPESYAPHPLHVVDRQWPQGNCYVDLWIEILHSYGLDPVPVLGCCIDVDFDSDQWTFFKPHPGDIWRLYGIQIVELNVWQDLLTHAIEVYRRGDILIPEVDSFYLPDDAATSYRQHHAKTAIGVVRIDPQRRVLDYIHSGRLHRLEGEDFEGIFQMRRPEGALGAYVEVAKVERRQHLSESDLLRRTMECAREHVQRLPRHSPFPRFLRSLEGILEVGNDSDLDLFHRYAFATTRQLGASAELAATYLGWLAERGASELEAAALELNQLSTQSKGLMMRLARFAAGAKRPQVASVVGEMEERWARATTIIKGCLC